MEERIEVLFMANLIDHETKEILFNVIKDLDEKFSIKLTEDNGSIMITHLGRALMRAKVGEIINGINDDVLTELKESENFGKVQEMYQVISKKFSKPLPENEIEYMYANLMFLLEE